MAQKNVTIAGNQYPIVPSIEVPITGGGTASFIEISDTTATVDKVLQGYDFYDASGQKCTGTASTSAIAVVDTLDSHGGTIREITAVDISQTTATAEDVADGKVFFTANGTLTVGTAEGGTAMTLLSYGNSTWAEFLAAYNTNTIVYCRASSNSNPATGSQTRLAFMAYVNNATDPTNVEFQYYRSVSSHSATQQGDQVYVYKLDKTSGWSVTVREAYTKIAVGTGLTSSYSNGTLTISLA